MEKLVDDKVQQEELVVDCGEVCKYYREKSNGDIDMQYASAKDCQQEVDFTEKAVGTIFPIAEGDKKSHHYGYVNVLYNGQKYRIVVNTTSLVRPSKKDEDVIEIQIGTGLQTDWLSCSTLTLCMMKTLLKDNGKIAKSLIEFYNENKEQTNTKVTLNTYVAYSLLKKNFEQLKKECNGLQEYNTLDDFVSNIKEHVRVKEDGGPDGGDDVYYFLHNRGIYIYYMLGHSKEDLEKGPNLLSGISNDNFSEWEYAGEFLKLSQNPIFHKFDDKVTTSYKGKTISLKDYSNFYTASGSNVDSITRQIETLEKTNEKLKKEIEKLELNLKSNQKAFFLLPPEATMELNMILAENLRTIEKLKGIQNKSKVFTKIYAKEQKYILISQNKGEFDDKAKEQYRENVSKIVNPNAKLPGVMEQKSKIEELSKLNNNNKTVSDNTSNWLSNLCCCRRDKGIDQGDVLL